MLRHQPSDAVVPLAVRLRVAIVPAALASLALLAAACGASSPPKAATGGSPQTFVGAAFKYAHCMRDHGLANFPEPQIVNHGGEHGIRQAVPASVGLSPQFKKAQQACQSIMPAPNGGPGESAAQQQAHKQALLAFAKCLRGHGLTKFPDPTAQGQLTLEMIHAAGVDLHAPDVLPAARACVGVSHGMITMADVAQAINGPH